MGTVETRTYKTVRNPTRARCSIRMRPLTKDGALNIRMRDYGQCDETLVGPNEKLAFFLTYLMACEATTTARYDGMAFGDFSKTCWMWASKSQFSKGMDVADWLSGTLPMSVAVSSIAVQPIFRKDGGPSSEIGRVPGLLEQMRDDPNAESLFRDGRYAEAFEAHFGVSATRFVYDDSLEVLISRDRKPKSVGRKRGSADFLW